MTTTPDTDPTTVTVTVNGVPRLLATGATVADVVQDLLGSADAASCAAPGAVSPVTPSPVTPSLGALLPGAPPAGAAPGAATGVAVAVDDAIVPRGLWATTTLAAGARVEVVTAVQGG